MNRDTVFLKHFDFLFPVRHWVTLLQPSFFSKSFFSLLLDFSFRVGRGIRDENDVHVWIIEFVGFLEEDFNGLITPATPDFSFLHEGHKVVWMGVEAREIENFKAVIVAVGG